MVTVCIRQSANSSREDDVNVPDVAEPVVVNVIDVVPPSAHGEVVVRDRPSGETATAVFIAAWFTVAATTFCVVDAPEPDEVEGVDAEGADGLCPPHPARRTGTASNAAEQRARIAGILADRLDHMFVIGGSPRSLTALDLHATGNTRCRSCRCSPPLRP